MMVLALPGALANSLHSLMRMRIVGLLVLAGCTADVVIATPRPELPVGEGSGSGSGNNSQTSITPTQYLDEIAKIQCDQAFHCRAEFPATAGYVFETVWSTTPGLCAQTLLAGWSPTMIETEIAKGRIMFDGAAALACLQGVTFAACPEYWNRGIEWADACYHVLVGMVPSGGECEIDYDCTSYYCDTVAHRCY